MEMGKVLMQGLMAGIMVGVVAGIVILGFDSIGFLSGVMGRVCFCLAPFTCIVGNVLNVGVWAIAALASLGAGLFAAKKITGFTGPGDMLVGGAAGGFVGGIVTAICASVVTIIFPIVSAVLEFLASMLGYATSANKNLGSLVTGAIGNILSGMGWIALNMAIFFTFGLFLGIIGGIIGSFVFKGTESAA